MKNLIFAGLMMASLTACSTLAVNKSKVGTTQASINNTQWTLAEEVKGKTPTLVIENGKVSGNAGCNNYFGELFLNPAAGTVDVSRIGSTKMACPNLSEEMNYIKMLDEANKYVVNGNTLELYRDSLLLLKFVKR